MNKGLLDGVVVLDLTRVLAGPYSGMMLADMGATVIKLENPKGGDDTRKMGPFVNDNSVYYANFNRSKLGCTLNLKDPDGKEMFIVYHIHTASSKGGWDRQVCIDRMGWDENGKLYCTGPSTTPQKMPSGT